MSDYYIDDDIMRPEDYTDYLTYKSFYTEEEFEEFMLFFKSTKILYYVEKIVLDMDRNIIGSPLQPIAVLKIHPEDFIKTNELYQQYLADDVSILQNHILFQYSNEELIKIVTNSNTDWSLDNLVVARAILANRKVAITPASEVEYKENSISIFVLLMVLVFGLIPIIYLQVAALAILISIFRMTKNLPDGQTYYTYDSHSRSTSRLFFYLLIIYILISYVYLILK